MATLGCPGIARFTSSKSSAWAAAPLISAADNAGSFFAWPMTVAVSWPPCSSISANIMSVSGSAAPGSVQAI